MPCQSSPPYSLSHSAWHSLPASFRLLNAGRMATGALALNDPRPFRELLSLVVRAFYPGPCPPKHFHDGEEGSRNKLAKVDTTGLAIVVMDYLLAREWVGEEQICAELGQHQKVVRRALKYLEHENFLMGEHRRETKRSQKHDVVKAVVDARQQQMKAIQVEHKKPSHGARHPAPTMTMTLALALALALQHLPAYKGVEPAAGLSKDEDDEEEGLQKAHTFSYWAVDLVRAFDMVQLRLHVMRKLLKDELDAREALAKYLCKTAHCGKEYDSYDMPDIMQCDGSLQCAMCGGVVEQVFAMGKTGDDAKIKERREHMRKVLHDMDSQLTLQQRVSALRLTQPPHPGSLTDWAKAQQARLAPAQPGDGRPGAAGRVRLQGGVTQLTAAASANKNAEYQETHVQVTLTGGAGAAGGEGGAGAGGPAGLGGPGPGAAPVVSLGGPKRPSAAQPFFLKNNVNAGSGQPAPQQQQQQQLRPGGQAGQAGGTQQQQQQQQQRQDAFTQQMLASLGPGSSISHPGAARVKEDDDEPPHKRVKQEWRQEGQPGVVKKEEPQPEVDAVAEEGGSQAPLQEDAEEWEEI
ncbi:hypothetical protein QJQ45_014439 [Haematococcus lacustris]|nr:hypothetical protein QJQ45_014439 [Haematococcus lacustris]